MRTTRLASIASGTAIVALLSACATESVSLAPVSYPAPAPAYASAPAAYMEYGQVINIDYFPGGTSRSAPNVGGAILGAVAGAVLGNQIGGGSGRDAATVLGGAAGAAVGSQVGRTRLATDPVYRITMRTDQGVVRIFDVPATGDLRVGDRVRVDNGVIYRA
jgi:outer membrane lipoprotein SlyB